MIYTFFLDKGQNMEKNKRYSTSLFIILCLLLNLSGKCLAQWLKLPIWMDSFGTIAATYVLGPVCGVIVGVTINTLYSIIYSWTYICYAVVSALIAVIAGVCIKKDYMKTLLGALTASFYIAFVSCVVSAIFNYIFFNGYTNNIWGDGVIDSLISIGFNNIISYAAGQFYVDFLDKVIAVLILFVFVKFDKGWKRFDKRVISVCLMFALASSVIARIGQNMNLSIEAQAKTQNEQQKDSDVMVQSDNDKIQDYSSYLQTVYGRENGIPGGCANDIVQTNDGILWIGTYGGLYRYNGKEFVWIDEYDSIKSVNCMYLDEEGRLWIGTNDNGLSIMINEQVANVVSEKDGLSDDAVKCITQGTDGCYYVGTTGKMSVLSMAGGLSVKKVIDDVTYAVSIDADKSGNVAAVSDSGKLSIIRDTDVISQYIPADGSTYTTCTFDEDGILYAGTSADSIDVYRVDEGILTLIDNHKCNELKNIKSLKFVDNISSREEILFVCADNGIGYYNNIGDFVKLNTGNFNSSIDNMTYDYQGNLWFVSSRQGILRLSKSAFTQLYNTYATDSSVVNTVTWWNDGFYIGTDNGLYVSKDENTNIKGRSITPVIDVLNGVRIRCLKEDSKGNLWICTSRAGVYKLTTDGGVKKYDKSNGLNGELYRTVTELSDNTILVAGDSGMSFIKDDDSVYNIGTQMINSKVLCTLQADDKTIFAGTDGNGIEVIRDGVIVGNFGKNEGLSSGVILRMVEDSSGDGIFIVTSNSICYMDKTQNIRVLKNFPYYNNYDIVNGKDGMLFVLSSAGIFVVDEKKLLSGDDVEYRLLNNQSGLQNAITPNSWNYMDKNNNLYISTEDGVIVINLENYSSNIRSYRIQMKSIQVDDELIRVRRGEDIYINSGAHVLEMFPEIVNYSVNVPYVSIYLEGYDSEPRVMLQSELNNIVYRNIPVGTYRFHLAVLDDKGKVTVTENIYTIIKKAEMYNNWWFKIYMVAVFAIIVAYITWIIFHTQVKRTLDFQKKELEFVKKQLEMGNETVMTIARTVDAKDINTSQHSLRVSEYSVLIAKALGYNEDECENLKKAALLHDIGKIGIPDRILNKPDRLTDEEYALMKSHVEKGAQILKNFTLINNVEEGALYHHERYDGSGYMYGLKGEEIPLNARIIGIADAFDAMTANRVYRKKLDKDYVIREIKRGSGTQFDPKLVEIMLGLIEKGLIDIDNLYKDGENHGEQ